MAIAPRLLGGISCRLLIQFLAAVAVAKALIRLGHDDHSGRKGHAVDETSYNVKDSMGRVQSQETEKLLTELWGLKNNSVALVTSKKAEYARLLTHQIDSNQRLAQANAQTSTEIQHAQRATAHLQLRADVLVNKCGKVTGELLKVRSDLTTIGESTRQSLSLANNLSQQALGTLAELAEEERSMHMENFNTAHHTLAMFQTKHKRMTLDTSPRDQVAEEIRQAIADIRRERVHGLAAMRVAFEARLAKDQHGHAALMQEQEQLHATLKKELKLVQKLTSVVDRLSKTFANLIQQRDALVSLADHLGDLVPHESSPTTEVAAPARSSEATESMSIKASSMVNTIRVDKNLTYRANFSDWVIDRVSKLGVDLSKLSAQP